MDGQHPYAYDVSGASRKPSFTVPKMSESPPGSPLSSHASSEFAEDIKTDDREQSVESLADPADAHLMPPSKRRKTGDASFRSTPIVPFEGEDDEGEISSDTDGSIPASELGALDDDHHEQVTACRWEGCPAGDLGNMDELVKHIHEDHIGQRQKKYICQWVGCGRQGSEHASGYALKAHTRSHTKEKPFMCFLPECDRSFTRSDALAKHLRTVHETDNLKPSDPIPRSHSSHQKPQRLKLVFNSKPPSAENNDSHSSPHPNEADERDIADLEDDDDTLPRTRSPSPMPEDLNFTEEELVMPPSQLFRLLRRQVHWAEQEGTALTSENEALDKKREEEWQRKELVLANLMEAELSWAALNGEDGAEIAKWQEDLPFPMLPIVGPTPWYRQTPPYPSAPNTRDEVGKWVEGIGNEGQAQQEITQIKNEGVS
ncbi:MAG: hypothetical protein Q9222_007837 [Ikaeria aurantiellina]